ncbi:AIS_HP2_G0017580.mRNA.1.CDS.1 [Saccharomyces cerevisiae]|nr:AIS_HP2_G0017580.mRNA.1.CDS.1 [Saccharomyces cerevisiae]CAI6500461.1 AIS_HP2_G0017580.mRNA.1.CDS.1 [Saccharomyces cerevisiae]
MGIPKFFRYISERWPMILQLIEGTQIPEFDNLYLDMNSILHNCTHGNDDDVTKRLTEEEVFAKICTYIDHLFQTIKPNKIFYMAIDGVAPRAKMNQQRARRFRTAMDAEKAMKKAIENGDEIPKGEPFDSNSITPGTEFMAKLTKNLQYFIHDKISNDSKWREVQIIFSGHEVPGEGEHKIMNFIRHLKSQKDFNQNTRHCIYGLDADLIMLGLSTHGPHFALLREEVTFGRRNSEKKSLEHQNFYLLHLSLLREYMELEFKEIADEMRFEYDFERILDDFILVMFVIGNDFLPNLPDLHLNKGAFPVLLQTFKEALLHTDGYINEHGKINLKRLGVWLDYLSQFELLNFEKEDIDVEWFNKQLENISLDGERKRQRVGKKLLVKQQKKLIGSIKPWLMEQLQGKISPDLPDEKIPTLELPRDLDIKDHLEFLKEFAFDLGLFITHSKSKNTYSLKLDLDSINPDETDEEFQNRVNSTRKTIKKYQNAIIVEDKEELETEKTIYNERFEHWKHEYYRDKLKYASDCEERVTDLSKDYVEGLQWVLYYYYRGCPSWSWYYPHHYAPRISDLVKGLDQDIEFDLSKPFTPFQQLMAVLPERSKNLIPPAFRPLMYDEQSPIHDFYPAEVQLDKNGKTADWEAVVLISFVDEKRLIEAMQPYLSKLSPEEKTRNQFGKDLIYSFNPQVDVIYKSPLGGIFSDIEHNHCVEKEYVTVPLDSSDIRYGLLPNAKLGAEMLAGFPTLLSLPFTNSLEYNETMVFQQPSRQQSMVLQITDIYQMNNVTLEDFSKRHLNKVIYTRWPCLRESKLVSLTDGKTIYEYQESNDKKKTRFVSKPTDTQDKKLFNSLRNSMLRMYAKQKAVKLGPVEAIATVFPVTGLVRDHEGGYVKTFSSTPDYYPLQLVVESVVNEDERYKERGPIPIEEEFPLDSKVIFLGDYAYGGETTIDGYSSDRRLKITVEKKLLDSEPTIGKERLQMDHQAVQYFPSYIVSKNMHLHPLFLSKITSKFMITDATGKHINVGIPVKFEARHQKVLGYARRNPRGWEYSNLTINVLKEYRQTFPEFFYRLSKVGNDIPVLEDLFPNISTKEAMNSLDGVKQWLKYVSSKFIAVSLESDSLTKTSIAAVEEHIMKYAANIGGHERKQLAKVPRKAVLNPRSSFALLRSQKFDLGDRVVYIQDSGKVPIFSKGTVVGYTTLSSSLSIQVLFDNEIVAGNDFGGRLRTNRGLGLDASFLLNITNRQFIYHSKASKKVLDKKKQPYNKTNNTKAAHKTQPKPQSEEKLRKERAHDLLNYIKKDTNEKEAESEKDKKMTSQKSFKPAKKTLLKRPTQQNSPNSEIKQVDVISSEKASLNDPTVAGSIFNAVANQYSDSMGNHTNIPIPPHPMAMVGGPLLGANDTPGVALPYNIPPNFIAHPNGPHPLTSQQMPYPNMNGIPIPPPRGFGQPIPFSHPHHMANLPDQGSRIVVNEKESQDLKKIINGAHDINGLNADKIFKRSEQNETKTTSSAMAAGFQSPKPGNNGAEREKKSD